jgi:hypothetical protein
MELTVVHDWRNSPSEVFSRPGASSSNAVSGADGRLE